ncbi:uncharacterized protein LOC144127894 isoform X2 [Amblyomma americanum]
MACCRSVGYSRIPTGMQGRGNLVWYKMRSTACLVLLLLVCETTASAYEEKNFFCPQIKDDSDEPVIAPTSVCDGTVDCDPPSADDSSSNLFDESPEICAPPSYLEKNVTLKSRDVTSTSAKVSWSAVTQFVSDHKLKLAGYFFSGKSAPHSFQNTVSARLNSYQLQWLKPWTEYTLVLRPFYTVSGKHEREYKLGRAASATLKTLSSEPELPGLVSVLASQERNLLLSIVGPSAWNSNPAGFHVRWQATTESQGPRGELDIGLPADWSPEENVLNATLPLKGGIDYHLFVSAVGSGDSEQTLRGPEVQLNASVPLDSYELSATAIDYSRAVVSWRSSERADIFKVTVFIDEGEENWRAYTTRVFEGTGKVTSRYSAIITELQPWKFYMVRLEGCIAENCSGALNTTFSTLPEQFPSPSIIRVEATDTSSFELAWVFPEPDRRVFNGFRVRYCPKNVDSCFLIYTKDTTLKVNGLEPGSVISIDVRAQFISTRGRLLLGPPGTATVSTWTNVPVAELFNEAIIRGTTDAVLLSWRCSNSSFDHLQYKTTERGQWTTCDESANCEATVNHGRTRVFTSGDLILTQQSLRDYVWVRCCNNHGCGNPDHVTVRSDSVGHPSITAATVIPDKQSAVVKFVPRRESSYEGFEVKWRCNGDKEATSNYEFSKREFCNPCPHFHGRIRMQETTINGLPTNAEECEFFVSIFQDIDGRRYYSSPLQAVQA